MSQKLSPIYTHTTIYEVFKWFYQINSSYCNILFLRWVKSSPQKKEKEKKIELFSYQISHLQLQDCNVFFFAFRLEIKEIVVSESWVKLCRSNYWRLIARPAQKGEYACYTPPSFQKKKLSWSQSRGMFVFMFFFFFFVKYWWFREYLSGVKIV